MINWLKKLFSKKERALYYDVVISNDDAKELEYYWESLYYHSSSKMKFRKQLFPSLIKKGLRFYSDSGILFEVTKVMADGGTIHAKRISDEN